MDGSSTPTLVLVQILHVAIGVNNTKQRGTIGAWRLPANNSPVYVLSILKASAHPSIQQGMTRLANFAMGTSFARFPRCPRTWLRCPSFARFPGHQRNKKLKRNVVFLPQPHSLS
jgi:hypothetical protein